MNKKIKKILKIFGIVLLILCSVLIVLFYLFSIPKSNKNILEDFSENNTEVFIRNKTFKSFRYRVVATQKVIDTSKITLVFIHGAIGTSTDFKKYMFDKELNSKANLISYDRVGYGIHQTGNTQGSIAFETELLEDLVVDLDASKIILVGYSYGGPIALASKKKYKKIILLAPALYSKSEKMPWALNLYSWEATRWLVPKVWKAASKEKLSHIDDLQKFENYWNTNPSEVISIHGTKDGIVPYENSLLLKENFLQQKFELLTLENTGHGLVWTHFNEIKNSLIQQLN